MLTNEGLRVIAALNEALELRRSYTKNLREKLEALSAQEKDRKERERLFNEFSEFDAAFTSLLTRPAKKEMPYA
jgi:hypothetical protein